MASAPVTALPLKTKVVRFADKDRHQLFVEPEGLDTTEMYVQGMSTSMPIDVQYAFLRTIPGFEDVKMMRLRLCHRI